MKTLKTVGRIVAVAATGIAGVVAAVAAEINFNGGEGGDFFSPGIWTGGVVPGDGDRANVKKDRGGTEATVTLSADMTNKIARLVLGANAGRTLTFDGNGFDLIPSASATDVYAGVPGFAYASAHGYYALQQSTSADAKLAPYAFTDPRIVVTGNSDATGLIDFCRGTFNFRDPGGVDNGRSLSFGGYEPSQTFRFSGTSSLLAGQLDFTCNGSATESGPAGATYRLEFLSGTHEIGQFRAGNEAGTIQLHSGNELLISNSTVSVGRFYSFPRGIWRFTTASNGVFNVGKNGQMKISDGANGSWGTTNEVVVDHATWNIEGNATFSTTTPKHVTRLCANESTFNHKAGRVRFNGNANSSFAFTNVTWNGRNGAEGDYASLEYGANVQFVGGSFKVDKLALAANGTACLSLDGGTHEIGTLAFGCNSADDTANLVVDGGAELTVGGAGVGYPYYSRCHVDVRNGTLVTPAIALGLASRAVADDSTNQVFRLGAGFVSVTGGNGVTVAATAGRNGVLILDGGVLETTKVCGGLGSKCRTPDTGSSSLMIANGGTLAVREPADQSVVTFVSDIDTVELGSKGLVLDTKKAACSVVNTVFDGGDSDGALVKVGEGALSIGGLRGYYVSETRVEQGVLQLTDATTMLETALVVSEGATLSLAGEAAVLNVSSLAVTNGVLLMDAADVIAVSGGVSFSGLRIRLTAVPETGADPVTLMVVDGEMSEADAAAWNDALLASTTAVGSHGRFTAEYDPQSGKTTLKMQVVADQPLTQSTTWVGQDGDWSKSKNWSNGLPQTDVIAVFADNGAVKTVNVGTEARAGSVRFDADGFTLQGGTLTLKATEEPASVVCSAGTAVVGATVHGRSALEVRAAEGAVADLASDVRFDREYAFAKRGAGSLVIRGDNVLGGDVCLDEGLTEVRSLTNAFGRASSVAVVRLASTASLKFYGGVVELPLYVMAANDPLQIVAVEGVTSVGYVRIVANQPQFTVEEGARLDVRDEWRCGSNARKFGLGTFSLGGTVCQGLFVTQQGETRIAATKLGRPRNGDIDVMEGVQTAYWVGGRVSVDTSVLNDEWNTVSFMGGNGVFDLNGHDVGFGGITELSGMTHGEMTSAAPARFTHYGNAGLDPLMHVDISGAVTFVFRASGKQLSVDAPMSTTGGLVVSNGTVTVTERGSWKNAEGATVLVGGADGRLVLSRSGAFSKKVNFDLRDNGVLELPAGVLQRCALLSLNGAEEPAALGTWGATGSGAQHIDDVHFFGSGVLDVRGDKPLGLLLLVR